MQIEELTLKQIREIQALGINAQSSVAHPWKIGSNYFIRTVTFHYTGTLVAIYASELVLKDAAWIADDGRFADAMKSESFAEVEPFPDDREVIIPRGGILDATIINKIPRSQK